MCQGVDATLVTVIIPCYNREKFVGATIESVLAQTWRSIEIIVIDDGSTDRSREILESYRPRVVLLEHPGRANRGQAASINLGLKHSVGQYLGVLDADDLYTPRIIEKQVQFLNQHANFGLVYVNCALIDSAGDYLYDLYPPNHTAPAGPEQVLEGATFIPSGSLFRRTVFEKVGYLDETLRAAQDHDFGVRIAEVAKVGYLGECLCKYRRHPGSVGHTRTMERWRNGFRILEAAKRRYPYSAGTVRRRRAVLHFRLAQCQMAAGQYAAAAYHFALAGVLNPIRSLGVLTGRERLTGPQ